MSGIYSILRSDDRPELCGTPIPNAIYSVVAGRRMRCLVSLIKYEVHASNLPRNSSLRGRYTSLFGQTLSKALLNSRAAQFVGKYLLIDLRISSPGASDVLQFEFIRGVLQVFCPSVCSRPSCFWIWRPRLRHALFPGSRWRRFQRALNLLRYLLFNSTSDCSLHTGEDLLVSTTFVCEVSRLRLVFTERDLDRPDTFPNAWPAAVVKTTTSALRMRYLGANTWELCFRLVKAGLHRWPRFWCFFFFF